VVVAVVVVVDTEEEAIDATINPVVIVSISKNSISQTLLQDEAEEILTSITTTSITTTSITTTIHSDQTGV